MKANIVHAKVNGMRGEFTFRIWKKPMEFYVTKEMTEDQTRRWFLENAIANALEKQFSKIDGIIRRAKINGTSVMTEPRRDLKSWKKRSKQKTSPKRRTKNGTNNPR
jgi:hypothetical protein